MTALDTVYQDRLLDLAAESLNERLDHAVDKVFRHTRTRGHKHGRDAFEPRGVEFACIIDQTRWRAVVG